MESYSLDFIRTGTCCAEVYEKVKDIHPERTSMSITHAEKPDEWWVHMELPKENSAGKYVASHYGGRRTTTMWGPSYYPY